VKSRRLILSYSLYLLLAASALTNCGCLLVAAGAAGGAAAGYAYVKGKVCDTYNANLNDTWAATHTALAELGMQVIQEEREGDGGVITSRTADGDRVRINIIALDSRIPAEGRVTRVCVRVATFGDHPVSNSVLDQIGRHLAPATSPVLAPVPAPTAQLGVIQTGATAEPPLATPPPAKAPQTVPPPSLPLQPVPMSNPPAK
jgi:hypothetical protein